MNEKPLNPRYWVKPDLDMGRYLVTEGDMTSVFQSVVAICGNVFAANMVCEALRNQKPTPQDKRDGLKPKYHITHADGTPCDPNAAYFVLRLDYHPNCDRNHIDASLKAAETYATTIARHLPELASDLLAKIRLERNWQ